MVVIKSYLRQIIAFRVTVQEMSAFDQVISCMVTPGQLSPCSTMSLLHRDATGFIEETCITRYFFLVYKIAFRISLGKTPIDILISRHDVYLNTAPGNSALKIAPRHEIIKMLSQMA